MEAMKPWHDVFKLMKGNTKTNKQRKPLSIQNIQKKKISFKNEGEIKTVLDQ